MSVNCIIYLLFTPSGAFSSAVLTLVYSATLRKVSPARSENTLFFMFTHVYRKNEITIITQAA